MVIGWAKREDEDAGNVDASAWEKVEATQQHPRLPCLLVPQPAHAALSGEFASALLPEIFGDIPAQVQQAISMHDTGWSHFDAAQIRHLRSGPANGREMPVSFVKIPAKEAVEAWTTSVDVVERLSAEGGWIVSRHFSLLAEAHPSSSEFKEFVHREQKRQRALQDRGISSVADLECWAAALGFLDLLSLYLLCGIKTTTSLPLVHPASPQARTARRTTLKFAGESVLEFTPQVFSSSVRGELEAVKHPLPHRGPRVERLAWQVA
jgi:Protein of unknown function (DUF3891)